MTDINKLGEEVAALIKGAEKDKAKIAPMLRTVWAELEAKKEVNGMKSKGAWAAKFGITLRYCQYLVKDGSRKDQRKDANSVRPKSGFLARCAEAKEKLAEIRRKRKTTQGHENIMVLEDQADRTITEMFNEFLALIAPEGYRVMQGDSMVFFLSRKHEEEHEILDMDRPEDRKKKRSATATKANATRAANKAKKVVQQCRECGKPVKCGAMLCKKHMEELTAGIDRYIGKPIESEYENAETTAAGGGCPEDEAL